MNIEGIDWTNHPEMADWFEARPDVNIYSIAFKKLVAAAVEKAVREEREAVVQALRANIGWIDPLAWAAYFERGEHVE